MTDEPANINPSGRDPTTGRWLKGIGGTGRRHRIDLLSMCDRKAREEGRDFEDLLWEVVKGLIIVACKGDVQAAKTLFHYFVKNNPGDPVVNVSVDARTAVAQVGPTGPVLPDAHRFASFLTGLGEFAERLREVNPDLNAKPKPKAEDLLS